MSPMALFSWEVKLQAYWELYAVVPFETAVSWGTPQLLEYLAPWVKGVVVPP